MAAKIHSRSLRDNRYKSLTQQYRLLLILPLILGIVLFLCVQMVISRQIQQAGTMAAQRFQAQSSGILHEIELVSDSLLSDGVFQRDLSAEDPEAFDPKELCATIRDHIRQSDFVSDVFLIHQKQCRTYSDQSFFLYPGRPGSLIEIIPDSYEIDLNAQEGWHILNSNYTPPYYISVIRGDNGEPEATLIVTLNMREFLHTLYVENTELCCIFNDEFSVSSLLTNHPGLDWRSSDAVSDVLGTRVRCFYIEEEDFTYLTAISTRSYYAPLWTIVGVFCIYFLLLLIVGGVYLHYVSRERYRNMVALLDGLPQAPGGDPTYEDILSSIRTSLSDYRERNRTERAHEALQRILLGSYAGHIPAPQVAEAGFPADSAGYYAVLFHISDGRGIIANSSPTINEDMTCMILDTALNRFAADGFHAAVTHIDREYCAVIALADAAITPADVRLAVLDTVQIIEQEYGFDLCATVSARRSSPDELHAAYQEAFGLFGFHRAVDSNTDVLMQEELSEATGILLNGDYMKQLQILSNTLLLEKYDYIPSMVESILDEHVARIRKHYAYAQDRIQTVANLLSDAVLSSSYPSEFKEAAAGRLRRADSISSLTASAREVFGYMHENARQSESEDTVSRACAYIGENLTDPSLSVPVVCEAVGVSVQHMSRLFRQKMNTTIVEYINSARIDRAKELLTERNLTVARIAESVGYNNTVTFTRNFRRYVGMAPSEYRDLNL